MKKQASPAPAKGKAKGKPAPPLEPKVHQMIFRLDDHYRTKLVALQWQWNKGTLNATLMHLLDVYATERAVAEQDRQTLLEVQSDLEDLRIESAAKERAAANAAKLLTVLTKRLPLVRPLNKQYTID